VSTLLQTNCVIDDKVHSITEKEEALSVACAGSHADVAIQFLDCGISTEELVHHLVKFHENQLCRFIERKFEIIILLGHLKSPILLMNKLFKIDGKNKYGRSECILSRVFMKYLEDYEATVVLKYFLTLYHSLRIAAQWHPLEAPDLLTYASLIEAAIKQIFESDCMDSMSNIVKIIAGSSTTGVLL
jgi:hypothetical protein